MNNAAAALDQAATRYARRVILNSLLAAAAVILGYVAVDTGHYLTLAPAAFLAGCAIQNFFDACSDFDKAIR